jgi:hypothetical protein
MNKEFLRRDLLRKEADIPNARLADFVQNPLAAEDSVPSQHGPNCNSFSMSLLFVDFPSTLDEKQGDGVASHAN